MSTATNSPEKKLAYENNPFFVAVNGIELLFKKAQAIGIALLVVTGLSFLSSVPSAFIPSKQPQTTPSSQQTADKQAEKDADEFVDKLSSIPAWVWVVIGVVVLLILTVMIFIGVVIGGVIDFTAAQVANGRQVSLSDAFRGVFAHFWGYLWVQIVTGFKIFLWTLLFIIPGIIMAIRYSLAGVVYFDKKLPGNGSVKESARLTKGAWLTTFASQSLFNIITFGLVEMMLVPGTNAILYRQYKAYDIAGTPKPNAHVLSWLTLIIPFIFFLLLILGVVLLVALLA